MNPVRKRGMDIKQKVSEDFIINSPVKNLVQSIRYLE